MIYKVFFILCISILMESPKDKITNANKLVGFINDFYDNDHIAE